MQDKFSYFMDRTEKDLNDLKAELRIIHDQVDKLWSFRALLLGFSMAVSGLTAVIVDIVLVYFEIRKH